MIVACIACSKTSATKRNFKAAIQNALDHQPACFEVSSPKEVPSFNGQIKPDPNSEVLVRLGLMSRIDAMVNRGVWDFSFDRNAPKQIPGYRYDLTETGQKYIGSSGRSIFMTREDPRQELCFGKRLVIEVVRYTEPGPAFGGVTATEVTYTWRLTSVAPWAKDTAVQNAFFTQNELRAEKQPQEARISLVLSNDGWHVPSGF
jgi:hypothetical protein